MERREVLAGHDALRARVQPVTFLRLLVVPLPDALHLEAFALRAALGAQHERALRGASTPLRGAGVTHRTEMGPRRRLGWWRAKLPWSSKRGWHKDAPTPRERPDPKHRSLDPKQKIWIMV